MTNEEWKISQTIYEASGKSISPDFYHETEQDTELATAHARISALEAALKDVTEGYIHETATGWGVSRTQVENSPLVKLSRAALEKTT